MKNKQAYYHNSSKMSMRQLKLTLKKAFKRAQVYCRTISFYKIITVSIFSVNGSRCISSINRELLDRINKTVQKRKGKKNDSHFQEIRQIDATSIVRCSKTSFDRKNEQSEFPWLFYALSRFSRNSFRCAIYRDN